MSLQRQPLCSKCCTLALGPGCCVDCGDLVKGVGEAVCLPCSIKRSNVRREALTRPLLVTAAARQLSQDFTRWCNDSGRASKLAVGRARYLQYLTQLDVGLQRLGTQALNQVALSAFFSSEDLRRMGLLAQYLALIGVLTDDASIRQTNSAQRVLRERMDGSVASPWADVLREFERSLEVRARPLSARTCKVYVQAAAAMLEFARPTDIRHLAQKTVDRFIARKRGMRASVSVFVHFLNEVHGLGLVVAQKKARSSPAARQVRHVRDLLDVLKRPADRPARVALIARLLSVLLNVRLQRLLLMRHSDIDMVAFLAVRVDGQWLRLPADLEPYVRELPAQSWREGIDFDPFVFQGRLIQDPLSVSTIRYHVRRAIEHLQQD